MLKDIKRFVMRQIYRLKVKFKPRKPSFRPELVNNGVEVSVRHLKPFFKFGHGRSAFKTKAVHDVSFDIMKGECFGLVGESGCGKTTTGRTMIRLYNATSGSVYFEGKRVTAGTRWNEKEIKWTKIKSRRKIKELKREEKDTIARLYDDTGLFDQLKELDIKFDKINDEIEELKQVLKDRLAQANNIPDEEEYKLKALEIYEAHNKGMSEKKKELKATKDKIAKLKKKITKKNLKQKFTKNPEFAPKEAEIKKEYAAKIEEIKEHVDAVIREQVEAIAQVRYDNRHVDKKLMSKMQMIFQDPVDSLDPRMTVEDIIQEGLHIQGQYNKFKNSKAVKEALVKVGLLPEYASRYPHEFSGGQRQRIGIARALIMKPNFLICDEPISALDVSIRAQIINLLNDLKEEMGLTMLFIAHDLSVVKYFCDRIAVMYYGEIVELASSDELFKNPLHPYTNALLSAIPKPDPLTEKVRKRYVYVPSKEHDYSKEAPKLVEIVPGHFVLANSEEVEKYKKKLQK